MDHQQATVAERPCPDMPLVAILPLVAGMVAGNFLFQSFQSAPNYWTAFERGFFGAIGIVTCWFASKLYRAMFYERSGSNDHAGTE